MKLFRPIALGFTISACVSCIGGRTPLPIGHAAGKVHSFQQLAPLSTSQTLSSRPTLTWDLAAGMTGAALSMCRDRACTTVLETHDVVGTSFTFGAPLTPGTYYWTLRSHGGDAGAEAGASSTTPTWQFTVGATRAQKGGARPGPIDSNGDGVPEIAVGAPHARGGVGCVTIHAMSQAVPGTAPICGTSVRGLGTSVSSAVDVDGDGFGDLVVGARLGDVAAAIVYNGSANGIDANAGTRLHAATDAVAGLGDVNGDGYGDILVGADLFLGGPHGISTEPSTTLAHGAVPAAVGDVDGDGLADAIVADIGEPHLVYFYRGDRDKPLGAVAWRLSGPAGSSFGASLGSAGDVNGDGFADVIVGAPDFGNGFGNAFVYQGNAHGLADAPAHLLIYPSFGAGRFGVGVGCAGDLDADGNDDVVVGAPSAGMDQTGAAFIFRGSPAGVITDPAQRIDPPKTVVAFGTTAREAGGVLAIGAPGSSTIAGTVFFYTGAKMTVDPLVNLTAAIDDASGPDTLFGSALARRMNAPRRARSL